MSTTESSEQTAGQRSTPTTEAGCEGEINRGVQGTAQGADFAELRRRAFKLKAVAAELVSIAFNIDDEDAFEACYDISGDIYKFCRRIDDWADAKDETRREVGD